MSEKAKRLSPTPETLRELFLKSGNFCAYPNCTHLMMNVDGVFIGQICHIEAAVEGGERFNELMTNEERRAFSNLMLMCYAHHQVTNDIDEYDAPKLQKMKAEHEGRFASPESLMLQKFEDQTERNQPTLVKTMARFATVLGYEVGTVIEVNDYIQELRNVPPELRIFIGEVSKRMVKMKGKQVVSSGNSGECILLSDLAGAMGVPEGTIYEKADHLFGYGLGGVDEMDTGSNFKPAVRISNLESGWPFWLDLVQFCQKADEQLETFTVQLDFERLD
jgi:hypothetical protein